MKKNHPAVGMWKLWSSLGCIFLKTCQTAFQPEQTRINICSAGFDNFSSFPLFTQLILCFSSLNSCTHCASQMSQPHIWASSKQKYICFQTFRRPPSPKDPTRAPALVHLCPSVLAGRSQPSPRAHSVPASCSASFAGSPTSRGSLKQVK